ncbi:MAG TPA: MBL fold metallo-hydrolase [Candidatus Binatia bacterium]|nr:MBL fold metallo-hydrolase [Candidatus Binatia bacterium]
MPERDVRVEMVGHATLRIHAGGRTLLTDPWLIEPICAGSMFHFPPLVHDLAEVAASTDAIHISHAHPDHFHRPTLAALPKRLPIYIARYRHKRFRDAVRALGFRDVVEAPFGEATAIDGTPFAITPLEPPTAAHGYDSAVVVRTPEFDLFANNDCVLHADSYRWVRDRFSIDYAFLGYSSASAYPICFEMPPAEKARLLRAAAERRFGDFLEAAQLLAPRLTVPFANGMRFLAARSLAKNAVFSSAVEAVSRVRRMGLAGEVMRPGDRIDSDHRVRRHGGTDDAEDEPAEIAAHAREMPGPSADAEPHRARRDDVVERFRAHVVALWRRERERFPSVSRYVIAYQILGAPRPLFSFDFSRPDDAIFAWGSPPRYDMRYTYPARALEMALDGAMDFEDVHFADDVSIHQVVYAAEYWAMLSGEPR